MDRRAATWAVAFFAAGPLAALFQVGYAESLFLLWLFLALWCVMRRRYGWLYAAHPADGLHPPGRARLRAVPRAVRHLALVLAARGSRCRRARSSTSSRSALSRCVVGFAWQVIAACVTGDPGAYLSTELAWRRNWIAGSTRRFVPFEGFVQRRRASGSARCGDSAEVAGYVVLGGVRARASPRCCCSSRT